MSVDRPETLSNLPIIPIVSIVMCCFGTHELPWDHRIFLLLIGRALDIFFPICHVLKALRAIQKR